jgi:hypothetical protein
MTPEEIEAALDRQDEIARQELMDTGGPEVRARLIEQDREKNEKEAAKVAANKLLASDCACLTDLPAYMTEDENPNTIYRGGPWLERGCGAMFVGTTGVGKSVMAMQIMLAGAAGIRFAKFDPIIPRRYLYVQSEDTPNRMARDLADTKAELAEKHPEVNWDEAQKRVKTWRATGRTGGEFLNELHARLQAYMAIGEPIDVVVINPLLAFIGGPITDGAYVTPFLRGGILCGTQTMGLQAILEADSIATLLFHHTPKPPSKNAEAKEWLNSPFPEYVAAGSADLINWVRSIITMQKIPEKVGFIQMTAGKNGQRLGWEKIGNATRLYMAYSGKPGVDGNRNAWRELTDDEYAVVVEPVKTAAEKDETSKKVSDIAPYVTKVLDRARASFMPGEFHGMTQEAITNAVIMEIQLDGRTPYAKSKMHDLLDELPPDIVRRARRKPTYYGTADDLAYWFKQDRNQP